MWSQVDVGAELPSLSVQVERATLVRYAGASGDFNPIHWNQEFATSVGLPDVIAHGMFTMASAARLVTNWVGDPGALVDYGVRFTRPVVVPNDGQGATIEITGVVGEKSEGNLVRVDITAKCEGVTVLAKASAVVRLA
jgi:acyl dehydratase